MLSVKTLTEVELVVKRTVKTWLHLPVCTTGGLLYSGKCDGGLSVPKLSVMIPSIQARRIHKLFHWTDETVSGLLNARYDLRPSKSFG